MLLFIACILLRSAEALVPVRCGPRRCKSRNAVDWSAENVERAFREGLQGETRTLKDLGLKKWSNPIADVSGAEEASKLLESAGSFFDDIQFQIYETREEDSIRFKWVASGTWPVVWRPRARIYGQSSMKNGDLADEWDLDPFSIFFRDVWPRLEDIYDLYVAPVLEKPALTQLKVAVGSFFDSYTVVQTNPLLVKRISLIDETNSRAQRLASALPDFAFSDDFKQRGAPKLQATPLSISVLPLGKNPETQKMRRRISWEVPIPSRFSSIHDLPILDLNENLNSTFVDQAWASQPQVEYVDTAPRAFLQAPYTGDVQDPEADALRRKLITAASAAGLPTIEADPPAIITPNGAKAIFNTNGHLVLAAYFSRRPRFLFPGSLAIELHPSVLKLEYHHDRDR